MIHAAKSRFSAKPTGAMHAFSKRVVRFLVAEDGPTTVEYAMVILLVLLAVLTVIASLGQTTAESFNDSANSVEEAFNNGS